MIWDLLTGLVAAGVGFSAIMLLCLAIGRIAKYISPYKEHQ